MRSFAILDVGVDVSLSCGDFFLLQQLGVLSLELCLFKKLALVCFTARERQTGGKVRKVQQETRPLLSVTLATNPND